MIDILFIAFEFPPLNRGGVYRPLSFVKHLPQYGINPIVITLHKDSYPTVFDTYSVDETLGASIIEQRNIIPVRADKKKQLSKIENFISIYFSIHGNEVNEWQRNFYDAIDEAVTKYKPSAIFATVPPFSILPLTVKISKKYNLPFIVDFRDAWSQWRTIPYGTYFHYLITVKKEREYLKKATAVIATSKQTIADFKKTHGNVNSEKIFYIPNGYEGELQQFKSVDKDTNKFTIGYVGSFYFTPEARNQMLQPWWKKKGHRKLQYTPQKQDWLYRSPYFFFKAIQQLKISFPELAKKLVIKFAGKKANWLEQMINDFGLTNDVQLIGEVSHKDSLAFQNNCDALLITSAKQIGGRDYSIAGKTFEYLQLQKPILAFVCEGAQKDLLFETGTAVICNPDDTKAAVLTIQDLISGKLSIRPDVAYLKKLSRNALTGQLAQIIKETVSCK